MRAARAGGTAVLAAAVLAACNPATTRPPFPVLRDHLELEVALQPRLATRRLAQQLREQRIPATRVEERDGYVESPWFDAESGDSVTRRPIGPNTVKLRAWVTPSRPYHSQYEVELVYRPRADPSEAGRSLEVAVPDSTPAVLRAEEALRVLRERYGERNAESRTR